MDWYKGEKHELIAYDTITDLVTRNTEVYTINPNGSGKSCVTCATDIPKGFVGQPAWHPNGEYLVVQAENANSKHTLFNHLSWGINNDLWLVKRDGTEAELIWSSPLNHASLHPHFNKDGTKLMFSERIATGRSILGLRRITPGGENQWDGWQIHVADFDINKAGKEKLSNHRILFGGTGGFYETHEFMDDGRIVYSHTPQGAAYVDDVYVVNLDGTDNQNLINSSKTWDEHGLYSPSGKSLAFISSRADPSWVAPKSKATTLTTELYLKNAEGEITQVTDVNNSGDPDKRYLVSDYDWDKDGLRIVFQVAPIDKKTGPDLPQLWMLEFREPP